MPTHVVLLLLLLPVTAGEFFKAKNLWSRPLVGINRLPGEFPSFSDLHLIYLKQKGVSACLFVSIFLPNYWTDLDQLGMDLAWTHGPGQRVEESFCGTSCVTFEDGERSI